VTRIRSVLLRVEVRPAGRAAKCAHDKSHAIAKGEPRFVVKGPGPAAGEKGYCRDCARAMLARARAVLDELARILRP
jgi:hypothetical protein